MENFDFITVAISQFISNSGLHLMYTFIIACFGISIIYKIVAGWITNKWRY